jgi:DNA-binding transcriptional LysR family regulator
MLDLRRLRLLRELKQRGTLAAVAEALSYTPSAISQQLSLLEAEAGVPLLEQAGRRVRLTPHAERLVEHTEAILERLEQAESDLAAATTSISGTVRMAVFQTAAHAFVPPALSALARSHPALRVEVSEQEPETALPAVVARELDLTLLEEYPGHPQPRLPELAYRHLATDPLHLAQPSACAARRLGDLARHPWIMEPAGTAARQWATTVCRSADFEPDVRYETSDMFLHARLVQTGHAIALLPSLLTTTSAVQGLHLSELPGSPARVIYTVTRRGASRHPALDALHKALVAARPPSGR